MPTVYNGNVLWFLLLLLSTNESAQSTRISIITYLHFFCALISRFIKAKAEDKKHIPNPIGEIVYFKNFTYKYLIIDIIIYR